MHPATSPSIPPLAHCPPHSHRHHSAASAQTQKHYPVQTWKPQPPPPTAASDPRTVLSPPYPRHSHSHSRSSAHAPRPSMPESGIQWPKARDPVVALHAMPCQRSSLRRPGGALSGTGRARAGRRRCMSSICPRGGASSSVVRVWAWPSGTKRSYRCLPRSSGRRMVLRSLCQVGTGIHAGQRRGTALVKRRWLRSVQRAGSLGYSGRGDGRPGRGGGAGGEWCREGL